MEQVKNYKDVNGRMWATWRVDGEVYKEELFQCDNCGDWFSDDFMFNGFCGGCYGEIHVDDLEE